VNAITPLPMMKPGEARMIDGRKFYRVVTQAGKLSDE